MPRTMLAECKTTAKFPGETNVYKHHDESTKVLPMLDRKHSAHDHACGSRDHVHLGGTDSLWRCRGGGGARQDPECRLRKPGAVEQSTPHECGIVHQVINALLADGAISTVHPGNTSFRVAAGGFEAVTNPSYVFTVQDSGPDAVSEADVNVLDNALGYVLNQDGTAHFSPDNREPIFSLLIMQS